MGRTVGLILHKQEVAKELGKFGRMTVEQLKEYATDHCIDIGNSNSVNGIIKKIVDAEKIEAETKKMEKPEAKE